MRLLSWLLVAVLQISDGHAQTASAEQALREMVTRDFDGDPTGRMNLQTRHSSIDVDSSRQIDRRRITFDLDTDALEIATAWHIDGGASSCTKGGACEIGVVFHVVATTVGNGMPSWYQTSGREIKMLPKSEDRLVVYRMSNSQGRWCLVKFPAPYVNPVALTEFFAGDAARTAAVELPNTADSRAIANHRIVTEWIARQREVIGRLQK